MYQWIDLHPYRHPVAQSQRQYRKENSADQDCQHCLRRGLPRSFFISGANGTGNVGQKSNTNGSYGAADQPIDRAGGTYRRGSLGSQRTDHGGIDVLYRRLHQLFQHCRPGQRQNRRHHFPGHLHVSLLFHEYLCICFFSIIADSNRESYITRRIIYYFQRIVFANIVVLITCCMKKGK